MGLRLFLFRLVIVGASFFLSADVLYADGAGLFFSDFTSIRIGEFELNSVINGVREAITVVAQWQQEQFATSLALYTVAGLILASYFLPRISRAGAGFWKFQRRICAARELKHEEYQMTESVIALREDIGKELTLLQEIGRHRALYPDERYLRTKLTQYQKTLKAVIPRQRKRK